MEKSKHDCPFCDCNFREKVAHKLDEEGYCTKPGCNYHKAVFKSSSILGSVLCTGEDYSNLYGYPGYTWEYKEGNLIRTPIPGYKRNKK